MAVRNPRRSFAPVAPSVAPIRVRRLAPRRPGPRGHVVAARTVQGMARVRSGQAPAWPLVSDRSVRSGSRVKRDFACTLTGAVSPVLVALRSQSRLRLEGRTRKLSGPSPGLSPAGTLATFRPLTMSLGPCSATHYEPVPSLRDVRVRSAVVSDSWDVAVGDQRLLMAGSGASRGMSGRSPGWL